MDFILELEQMDLVMYILKLFNISIFSYFMSLKFINIDRDKKFNTLGLGIKILGISIFSSLIKKYVNFLCCVIVLIILLSILLSKNLNKSIRHMMLVTTISLSINYIIFLIATTVSFFPVVILKIQNLYISFILISSVYIILLKIFLGIKRFKKGFSFLQRNSENEYLDILTLNISIVVLSCIISLSSYKEEYTSKIMFEFIIFAIIMFITIQKSLQLYYKQKLLEQELNKTKEDLANQIKDNKELEAENIEISKKAHTLDHKQKSLAKKIEEMLLRSEISTEEAAEVRERLNKIGEELYKEKSVTELTSTEIPEIDDMLKFMQSECSKNKIDFELQVKGNIHYMTNNLISKEDLETLLADHIKNAIIAINHTDNANRSILVKLGKIDETYGLYIYDSGVEFEKETLENLGKKPSTTHKDEGGTGMGFMNTFDTLRKCNASLIIEEFNEPSKDNYTKAIMIKFDNKNEFETKKRVR